MDAVEIVAQDGWAELVMNRPERRNAINGELAEGLADGLRQLGGDDEVRVILLRGVGGAFCSGLDLKDFNADPPPDWMPRFSGMWRDVHRALYQCGKPIVGALERFGINGGAALALASDLLVVGEGAFLQVGEVRQGLAAPYNMAWLRLRHGEALAARLTLVGRRFPGKELLAVGIAHECVADAEVVPAARRLAEEMAGYPAGALARIKATLRAYNDVPADEWFDRAVNAAPGRGPGAMQVVR